MIELKNVKWRNFLSYGNKFTEYNFEKGITRVSGINGQGKSTIVDAIYYGLFGKPYRKINIPKLTNTINKKHLMVELSFNGNGQEYVIRRGIKPDIFQIEKDGELIDQEASKKSYQDFLEEDILGFNDDIFQQIGIKSLTRYESFLTLPKQKKRHIVENIFGITILSEMKDLNKIHCDVLETVIFNLKKDENKFNLLLKQEDKNIERLIQIRDRFEADLAVKNEKKETEIIVLTKEIRKYKEGLKRIETQEKKRNLYRKKLDNVIEDKNRFERILSKAISAKNHCEYRLQEIENICPDCPNISKFAETYNFNEKNTLIEDTTATLEKQDKDIITLDKQIEKTTTIIGHKSYIEKSLHAKETQIKKTRASITEAEATKVDIDYETYNEYNDRLGRIRNKIDEKNEEMKYQKAIFGLLSDDGIKSYIIKKYLPILNKLVNTYLQKFSIDLEMAFDSELDIEIMTKFKESYAYDSFSEGEKKRINLAIMFTFLEFCKLKHSNASINLLILDEFSAGLDPEGENIMYDVLRDIVYKENKEVLTISHSALIDPEKVDRVINTTKVRGFSEMTLQEMN